MPGINLHILESGVCVSCKQLLLMHTHYILVLNKRRSVNVMSQGCVSKDTSLRLRCESILHVIDNQIEVIVWT